MDAFKFVQIYKVHHVQCALCQVAVRAFKEFEIEGLNTTQSGNISLSPGVKITAKLPQLPQK